MALFMIPGPVPPSPAVLNALASSTRLHYGPEWMTVWRDVLENLQTLFGTTGRVLNIPGSGSAGLDAAINSIIDPGDRVVVSVNGFHGERLALICEARGAEVVRVVAPWGEPVLAEQFEECAQTGKPARLFVTTHVETTTGVTNPIAEIAKAGKRHGALVMVDAVASLGGVPFTMDAWDIDIACASSQKCLGSAPGLAQIALNARALTAINQRAGAPRSWYLDLATWLHFDEQWRDWHPYPVTVPTGTTLALQAALQELVDDGIDVRAAHYRSIADHLRQKADSVGLKPLVEEQWASNVVTALEAPNGTANALVKHLSERHAIHVGSGFGPLQDRIIRVGHMSPSIGHGEVDALLRGISTFNSVG